jgi:hypothetical protein
VHVARDAWNFVSILRETRSYEGTFLEKLKNYPLQTLPLLLDNIGKYQSPVRCNQDFLKWVYDVIGPLDIDNLLFATSLFDADIETLDFYRIDKLLTNPLFEKIQKPIITNILSRIPKVRNIPKKVNIVDLPKLIPINYANYNTLDKKVFLTIIKSIGGVPKKEAKNKGEELAHLLEKRLKKLSEKYETYLLCIDNESNAFDLLRTMTFDMFTNAEHARDWHDFTNIWGKPGLLFFSCLACAEGIDKDTNRDFWTEYYKKWLNLTLETTNFNPNKVYALLKQFEKKASIPYHVSSGNRRLYVQTFRMHSIVANRPLSKHLLVRFLERTVVSNGMYYHDKDDQRQILMQSLMDFSTPLYSEDNETKALPGSYLQLPRETGLAFRYAQDQVLDFLCPLYDYMERNIIGISVDGLPKPSGPLENIPTHLHEEIENSLQKWTKDKDLIQMREFVRRSVPKTGKKPRVCIDLTHKRLEYRLPNYIFSKDQATDAIQFRLWPTGQNPPSPRTIQTETTKGYLITKEIQIPVQILQPSVEYEFSIDGTPLVQGTIKFFPIFDNEGEPLQFPCNTPQQVFCVAPEHLIVADYLDQEEEDIAPGYSLWSSFVGEDAIIIIEDTIYGLNDSSQRAGFSSNAIYSGIRYVEGTQNYRIIDRIPAIRFMYPGNHDLENDIKLIVNGEAIPFSILSDSLNTNGKGNSFARIESDSLEIVPNGTKVTIRVFDTIDQIDLVHETFFLLKNLLFQFSDKFYTDLKKVCIQELSFEGIEQLFREHFYQFPSNLHPFKLTLPNKTNAKLQIFPPVISIKSGKMNLFGTHCWFTDLASRQEIEVLAPEGFSNLHLYTEDRKHNIQHDLKQKGKNKFATHYLGQFPETQEPSCSLILSGKFMNQSIKLPVCTIHYRVSRKPDNECLAFVSQPKNVRVININTGMKIHPTFFMDPNGKYRVSILGPRNEAIKEWTMQGNEDREYYQEKEFASGIYKIQVREITRNPFSNSCREQLAYEESLKYRNSTLSESTDNNQRIFTNRQCTENIHEFKIQNTVRKCISVTGRTKYISDISIRSFFLEGYCNLEPDEEFTAKGFFYDHNFRRYDFFPYNPFKVKILVIQNNKVVLKILDKSNQKLSVDCRKGHINPNKSNSCDLEQCCMFYGKINR